jgi:putative phosphoesterase
MLRPEALGFLRGSDCIIHGGDIGDPRILEALEAIAPLVAVRGNNDHGAWARQLAESRTLKVDKVSICVVHDLQDLKPQRCRVVVSGHSHQPKIEERDGVLYVNPGSAGPRRFKLPVSVGELRIADTSIRARIKELL